ncbi:hypothetical protein ISREJYDI_CDS0027 [Pseudomonas phage UNO-G1W1]|uniref:Uncharacterized protein n=1 Tax=Pseudomonas phage UNO-G1W1 TaxID=3136609 RepID=A0AAX4MVL8_9CAUD
MQDFLGQDVKVGDAVVFTGSSTACGLGIVARLGNDRVGVISDTYEWVTAPTYFQLASIVVLSGLSGMSDKVLTKINELRTFCEEKGLFNETPVEKKLTKKYLVMYNKDTKEVRVIMHTSRDDQYKKCAAIKGEMGCTSQYDTPVKTLSLYKGEWSVPYYGAGNAIDLPLKTLKAWGLDGYIDQVVPADVVEKLNIKESRGY